MINYEKIAKLRNTMKCFSKDRALKTLKQQKISIKYDGGEAWIPAAIYYSILEWNKDHIGIYDIVEDLKKEIPLTGRDKHEIYTWIRANYKSVNDWRSDLFLVDYSDHYNIKDKNKITSGILAHLNNIHTETGLISVSDAMKKYGLTAEQVKKYLTAVHQGNSNGKIFVKEDEIISKQQENARFVEIAEIIKEFQNESKLIFAPKIVGYALEFLKREAYFGAECREEGLFLVGPSVAITDKTMILPWLTRFCLRCIIQNETNERALETLLKKRLPETYKVIEYAEESIRYKGGEHFRILKYLNAELNEEITVMSQKQLTDFLTDMQKFSFSAERKFENIIEEGKRKYKFRARAEIHIARQTSDGESDRSKPYPYDAYVIMCGLVFDEEYWSRHDILKKICKDQAYANVVLYMQLHFASMWRKADYLHIKHAIIPHDMDLETTYQRILNGDMNLPETAEIIELFEYESEKRVAHKNKQQLKICVPTSAYKYLSCVLVINEWHRRHNEQEYLIQSGNITNFRYYEELFKGYEDVFEGKPFSNLRASHSFADNLSLSAEQGRHPGEKYLCYLLISYARSHKGTLRQLPESTRHYLAAKTNGISLDEFMYNLFERGAFGFGLYLLLDVIISAFYGLHVDEQTAVMNFTNYKAYRIENAIQSIEDYQDIRTSFMNEFYDECRTEDEKRIRIENFMMEISRWFDEDISISKKCMKSIMHPEYKCSQKGIQCLYCQFGLNFRHFLYDLVDQKKLMDQMASECENENKAELYRDISDNEIAPAIAYVMEKSNKKYHIETNQIMQVLESAGIRLI